MIKKNDLKFIIISLLLTFNLYAQIQFDDKILISKDLAPNDINDFQIVDYDFDGKLDIVTISSGNNKKISLYKNQGNDIFTHRILISTNDGFSNTNDYFLRVVDINNDGNFDIITNGLNRINVFVNDGSNNFSELIVGYGTSVNVNYTNIEITDIDNDGQKDILAERKINSGTNSSIFWFKNDNLNFFPTQINYYNENPCFTDIENDGDTDIVCKNGTGGLTLIINNNNGQFSSSEILTSSQLNYAFDNIKVIDVNNDSLNDLILYDHNSPNGIKLLLKNSNLTYNTHSIFSGDFNYVSFLDYDNDGDVDLLVNKGVLQSSQTRIYYNNSLNFSSNELIYNKLNFDDGNNNYYTGDKIIYADVNNDNLKDLVYCNNDRIGYLKSTSNDGFVSTIISDYSMGSAVICDIDNNNLKDIVLKETSNATEPQKISWFKNLSDFNFTQINLEESSNSDFKINCGDINNDGDNDILSGRLYYDLEDNNIVSTTIINPVLSPSNLIDFDNDNDLDIIGFGGAANSGFNGQILLFKNNSQGNSFIEESLINSTALNKFKLVDIDNDDDLDIIQSGNSKIHLNNNDGTFISNSLNVALSSDSYDFCDIDNNGFKDIIYSDSFGLKVAKNYNNSFNIETILNSGAYPTVTDIDNDGDCDIVAFDKTNKRTIILINENQVFTKINVGNYIRDGFLNLEICYFVDDLDNDGDKDILMSSTNELVVYRSNFDSLSTLHLSELNKNIMIIPNPVNYNFKIITKKDVTFIEIHDILGTKINIPIFENIDNNISALPSGVYLIKVHFKNSIETIKIVKN